VVVCLVVETIKGQLPSCTSFVEDRCSCILVLTAMTQPHEGHRALVTAIKWIGRLLLDVSKV